MNVDFDLINQLFWKDSEEQEFPIREQLASEIEYVELLASYYTKHPQERHALYDEVTARASDLSLHFDYDSDISDKVRQRRPTESQASNEYRNHAWEPVNYGYMQKPLVFLQKIFNSQLSDVSYSKPETNSIKEGEDLESYLKQGIPKYKSQNYFNRAIVIRTLMQDPDGWIAVHSMRSQDTLDKNELAKPLPTYVPSCAVVDYSDDFVIVKTNDVVELGENDFSGCVYWVFTTNANYKLTQYGVKAECNFEAEIIDFHGQGEIACFQLGGIPIPDTESFLSEECKISFDSHVQPAIPFLNKMINMASDIDAIFALHMFLQKIEIETDCSACDGKGKIYIDFADQHADCESCKGSGYDTTSIFDTYKVKPEMMEIMGKLPDVAKYIEVPTNVIEIAMKREKQYLLDAFKALNMEFLIEEKTLSGQTAEAKRLDRDSLYVMLENIAKDVFRIAQDIADWINVIRYGAVLGNRIDSNRAVYRVPNRFDVESESQIVAQIKEISNAKAAPSGYLQEMYIQAAKYRFGDDTGEFAFVKASIIHDPLFGMDEGSIFAAQQSGKISNGDCFLHFNMIPTIHKAIELDSEFLGLDYDIQRDMLQILIPEDLEPDLQ